MQTNTEQKKWIDNIDDNQTKQDSFKLLKRMQFKLYIMQVIESPIAIRPSTLYPWRTMG